jgi:hypothetical protein
LPGRVENSHFLSKGIIKGSRCIKLYTKS